MIQTPGSESLEEENHQLMQGLENAGVHFQVNPRKTDIQKNISLWQAYAANGLCDAGTFGVHARKELKMDSLEQDDKDESNPFEDDVFNNNESGEQNYLTEKPVILVTGSIG